MSSNAAMVQSLKSMNNGRKESTSWSPVSLCCTNLNLWCCADPTQSDNIKATRPYEKTNCSSCSTFKQAAIRRLHWQKVWKLYPRLATWIHVISSMSWSTTTCKVSLSVGLNPLQLCACAGILTALSLLRICSRRTANFLAFQTYMQFPSDTEFVFVKATS